MKIFLILERYYEELYYFILASVGNKPDADDLLQIVGMRAYAARCKLRDEKKVRAWLYAIARNVIRSHYSTRKEHVQYDPSALENMLASYDEIPVTRLMVNDFIRELPDPWPRFLYLNLFCGLSAREIADMHGRNYFSVKTQLSRIKKRLRSALKEGESDETESTAGRT